MLTLRRDQAGQSIEIRESCGLAHELQVIEVAFQAPRDGLFALRDGASGRLFAAQRSARQPGHCFLLLELRPFETLCLSCCDAPFPALDGGGVRFVQAAASATIENGLMAIELEAAPPAGGQPLPGPVRRFRTHDGVWRGRTFFDTSLKMEHLTLDVLEDGPLRAAARFTAAFEGGHAYEATVTLDAGQHFARFDEAFNCQPEDQLVWDFGEPALPRRIRLLNSTEGFLPILPNYAMDNRIARLFAWTQGSQLFDLSDGFGLLFAEGDEAGFVTLEGGTWQGGVLNHMELWARRWTAAGAGSRRALPPESKADEDPSPEKIAARGVGTSVPHLHVESWLGSGRRSFALTCAGRARWGFVPDEALSTTDPFARHLPSGAGHFVADVAELGTLQQYHLRKIHSQRGIMPLQAMLGMTFEWPVEPAAPHAIAWPDPEVLGVHCGLAAGEPRAQALSLLAYLKARAHGFWLVSGPGITNPVSGRRIVPEMFHFENLARRGDSVLSPSERSQCRALFACLAYLYASENYYPGDASMRPVGDRDSYEPTVAGMCNQNFYTDCYAICGAAAQLFPRHPMAAAWRAHFAAMLRRQLAYHVYPDSGVWEESHTYYQHVLQTILPVLLRRRADGVDDLFALPELQNLARYALTLVTPRDALFDGLRYLAPLGDHACLPVSTGQPSPYIDTFAHYAAAFRDGAPALAANLAWLHREMGGTESGACMPAPAAPAWTSAYAQGLGYLFRTRDARGGEELLILRSGAAWGHYHHDDGSVQLYARGRAWISDASCGHAAQRSADKFEPQGHSRWEPRGVRPLGYLWRFNRGWIVAHDRTPDGMAWAVAYAPVVMSMPDARPAAPLRSRIEHWRTVIQLAAGLYVIVDSLELPERNIVRYHVPLFETDAAVSGNRATFASKGVVLDMAALPCAGDALTLWTSTPSDPRAARFATTCAEFDCGEGCLAVSAVALRDAAAPALELERRADGVGVRAAGRTWTMQLPGPREIVVQERSQHHVIAF